MINAAARLKQWVKGRPNALLELALALRDPFVHPRVVAPREAESVLVLAPHMDDEAIGCGGALLRHIDAGGRVDVVFLTDGRAGDARLYDPAVPVSQHSAIREALYERRCAEARAWSAAAGVARIDFLDGPDGRLQFNAAEIAARLVELLEARRPDIVYLPSPLDTHPDHRATNLILARALGHGPTKPLLLRGYEVWSPLVANAVMDIGTVVERKLELLGVYRSQLADVDYRRSIGGLAAYRSMLLPSRSGHAEAFIELATPAYLALLRLLSD